VTPEQAVEVIAQLNAFDYGAQADRNEAARLIESLRQQGNLPNEVVTAMGEAFQRLNAGGGVAEQEIFEYRRFGDLAAGVLDQLGTFLGVLDEMDTNAGRRYTEALVTASLSGDPSALRRLNEIMESEDTSERTRLEVGGAIERITTEFEGETAEREGTGEVPPPRTPASADVLEEEEEAPADGAAAGQGDGGDPLSLTTEDVLAMIGGGGASAYYGVPDQTGEGGCRPRGDREGQGGHETAGVRHRRDQWRQYRVDC